MDKLKEQLVKRLYRYLEEHLDPTVRAAVSTQHQLEILRCVAEWAHKDLGILDRIAKARAVTKVLKDKEARSEAHEKLRQKTDLSDELFSEPEFMDELEKL